MKQKIIACLVILVLSLTTFVGCTSAEPKSSINIEDEISQLKTDNEFLEERIEDLEHQVENLQEEVITLQDQNNDYTVSDEGYYESTDTVLTTDEAPAGTVWTTPSGSKYHESNCQYINGRTDLTYFNTAAEAENCGYSPCSICH